MTAIWEGLAPAKVNLCLKIVGRRSDGYHLLATVFQSVKFGDTMEISLKDRPGVSLSTKGLRLEVPPPENLAVRAAEKFFRKADLELGCRIVIQKRIPPGAGLGGGSSDAAAVLIGLNSLTGHPLQSSALASIAIQLGADVPYFLVGGTVLGQGIGEKLTNLPDLEGGGFVIVLPPVTLSTAKVYSKTIFPLTQKEFISTILSPGADLLADLLSVTSRLGNDLSEAACDLVPVLREACRAIEATEPDVGGVTGSGSALFAYYRDISRGQEVVEGLSRFGEVIETEPLTRKELEGARG